MLDLIIMSLQDVLNGEFGVNLAKRLARNLPEKAGFRLADSIARMIAARKNSDMVRCVRANQWVVSGKKLSREELDERVFEVFDHTADCLFDLYHNIEDPDIIQSKVAFTPKMQTILDERMNSGEGTLFVAPHLSNFDLAGRAITYSGYKMLVLSFPNPNKGYQVQNQLRMEYGIEIAPMSIETLRLGKKRLQEGKMILTGMDRPLAKSNYQPKFFGYPSLVPVTYVKLALQTHVPIVVVACVGKGDGTYCADASDPIYLTEYSDPHEEMERNAEMVLKHAEVFIRANPNQWSMFYPVWPWALEEMPQ
jgi:KDO2-lipid IV(A) lauroyltransferase